MRKSFLTVIVVLTGIGSSDRLEPDTGTRQSSESQSSPTVQIGDQFWMAENLNTRYFDNGDSIPEAKSSLEWEAAWEAGQPAWSSYEGSPTYGVSYGRLYNLAAVQDGRGVCPGGSRVPTDQDWKELEGYIGLSTSEVAATGWRGAVAGQLRSTRMAPDSHPRWTPPNAGATNATGFSALPGGYVTGRPNYEEQQQSSFRMLGREAAFWDAEGGGRALDTERTGIFRGGSQLSSGFGFAVRCVSDEDF